MAAARPSSSGPSAIGCRARAADDAVAAVPTLRGLAHVCEPAVPRVTGLEELHHEAERRGGVHPAGAAAAVASLERDLVPLGHEGIALVLVVVADPGEVVQA